MPSPKLRRSPTPNAGPSAETYRLIVDNVPQIVWAAAADGSIDYVNQRFFEYAGKRASQVGDAGWSQLVHPQDRPFVVARWASALQTGEPYECQCRLRRADGEYRWHLASARALRDRAGRVLKWFGTCFDIEEQMRAAQVLAHGPQRREPPSEAERRLRSIMTLWSDFYWETDAQHRFTVLETGGRFQPVMFVATRIGKTRWETPSVLPDAEGWRAHQATLAARLPFRDFRTARKSDDGVIHHYSIDGEPVFDADGRFRGYRGVGREITARMLAEQALKDRDRRFRAFLDSMPAIAWIKDASFRYLWISASYGRMLGKTLEDMRGRDDFEIWPPEIARQYRKDDELALRANGPVQSFESAPYPDGSTARLLVVKFPLPDVAGALGVAGIGFDMTSEQRGEAGSAPSNPLERLSGRERQVLQMIVDGHTSAEVGERLSLSPKSVDTYRSRIMAKLNIGDMPTLVKFAIRHRITTAR